MTFVLGGDIIHPDWFEAVEMPGTVRPSTISVSQWDALTKKPGTTGMKRFVLLLRQLASEFDAFGDTAEGRAIFAELETIRLPLKLRGVETVPRTVTAGTFLRAASRVLLERDPAGAASGDAGVVACAGRGGTRRDLANVLSRARHQALRRHQTEARPLRRAGRPIRDPRLRPLRPEGACPARTDMERLQRAVRDRPVVRRRRRTAGPDIAARRHRPQPAARRSSRTSPSSCRRRCRTCSLGNPKDLLEGKKSASGHVHGWLDLQLQHPDHHDLRVHLPEHLPVALRPDLPLDVVHQDLHPFPKIGASSGDG